MQDFSYIEYLSNLISKEGVRSLYKGLSTGLLGTVVSFGIYFFWYRLLKNLYYQVLRRKSLSDLDISVITLCSGVINSVLTNPIWFVNTRMTLATERKSVLETVAEIYKNEGFVAFYKGVLPNMVLVSNPVINFVVYENLKKIMLKKKFSLNFL
jgi:adenine nucleotide transporter 17